MPQSLIKSKTLSTKPKTPHSAKARARANPSKSSIHTARNAKVAKLQKQSKKVASGLTTGLEQKLAERAGHTEMIGSKGKRNTEGKGAKKSSRESGKKV